jgi:hypothetical protein
MTIDYNISKCASCDFTEIQDEDEIQYGCGNCKVEYCQDCYNELKLIYGELKNNDDDDDDVNKLNKCKLCDPVEIEKKKEEEIEKIVLILSELKKDKFDEIIRMYS